MIDGDIRDLLSKICGQTRRNYSASLREHGIHVGQDQALCQLWMEDGITQLELSERLGCEPPTVTNMIKKLEQYELVYRKRGEDDRRTSRVYLSEKGKAMQQPVEQIWREQQAKLLDGISPEERMLMRRLMKQMLENIT
ncbi:MarR family transcriptional regulator [Salicibibacter cibarius]|uniref:MarR family transcriptional regulator n=1 Tax=Salicibibacter cibarius TaxID=2743000 RepID=A0A7T7CAG9_9BACI|nr:MarR family transcriptional regulator [Salicibibacter cibarius]QQK74840.1 MarR family transcriptional regulator [Salicibibacter cibarius]